jgi:hypothetical protein
MSNRVLMRRSKQASLFFASHFFALRRSIAGVIFG